jgi:hypothetical protein
LNSEQQARRRLLRVVGLVSASLVAGACKGKRGLGAECEGLDAISPLNVRLRATLEYVDVSTRPDKLCVDCSQYVISPAEDSCGTCKLVPGPIHPKGTCKVFAPKVG